MEESLEKMLLSNKDWLSILIKFRLFPIRIPLPQIWFHIVTLNLPFGTLVIWYVQCGIVPSPIVMFIGPDGKKIVLLSFRALPLSSITFLT